MNQKNVLSTLDYLKSIHLRLGKSVDFSTENKARAIWYLQGAAISTGYSLWYMYERGLAVAASHQWRYLNEIRDLIALIENVDENDRRLSGWYKGHVVERRRDEQLPNSPGMPEDFYANEVKMRKAHLDDLSKYVHPTIGVARYNVYKELDHEAFDYEWSSLMKFDEILIIVRTAIICSIHGLLVPAKSLPVQKHERDSLNRLYDAIQALSDS